MDSKEQDKQPKVQLSIMLDKAVLDRLDYMASHNDRSRSWMINSMLKSPLGIIEDEDHND